MTHENSDYIQVLHDKGYRVTPQRLIVLDAVCDCQGHATLSDVQGRVNEMDPTIDRSTVYRALEVLREVGLIVESELGHRGKVYRVAGESDHHHLICLSCGKVLTINKQEVEPLLQHMQSSYGFTIQTDHLVFEGHCDSCSGAWQVCE